MHGSAITTASSLLRPAQRFPAVDADVLQAPDQYAMGLRERAGAATQAGDRMPAAERARRLHRPAPAPEPERSVITTVPDPAQYHFCSNNPHGRDGAVRVHRDAALWPGRPVPFETASPRRSAAPTMTVFDRRSVPAPKKRRPFAVAVRRCCGRLSRACRRRPRLQQCFWTAAIVILLLSLLSS